MNTFLDHYCERIGSEAWGEPFNIISNIAFLITGYLLYQKTRPLQSTRAIFLSDIWFLIGLVFVIGIGSALWHILALQWALWADRLPILAFISLFIICCLVRVFRLSLIMAFVIFILFQVINSLVLLTLPPQTLNGSLFYLPTGMLLFVITTILWLNNQAAVKNYFLLGSVTFAIAIVFRTMDLPVCDSLTIGTHFIWHILIAVTIFALMSGLIISISHNRAEIYSDEH